MSSPVRPVIDPADIWESLVDRGLSEEEATAHVQRLIDPERQRLADEERAQAERLLDVSEMSAGERAAEGVAGLGEAGKDIGRGLWQLARHPIQTAQAIARDPLAIVREPIKGLASGDPREAARAVGNIGSLVLPFARTSRAAGASTVGAVAGRAATAPARAIGSFIERPGLKNRLLRAQIERTGRPSGTSRRPAQPARPQTEHYVGDAVDDIAQAQRDYAAGLISQADLSTAMDFARRQMPRAQQLPVRGEVAASGSRIPDQQIIQRALEQMPRSQTAGGAGSIHDLIPATPQRVASGGRTTTVATPRPGEAAPGGGRYVTPGPHQKAAPSVRVASRSTPSDLSQRQLALIVEELKGVPRQQLPARLQNLRDMGILTEQQVAEILGGVP